MSPEERMLAMARAAFVDIGDAIVHATACPLTDHRACHRGEPMTDQTMRSLLEVHRTELNDKDARINELERVNSGISNDNDRLRRRDEEWKAAVERAETRTAEWKAKYDKRGEVIESLKLELAEARAAATKTAEENRTA